MASFADIARRLKLLTASLAGDCRGVSMTIFALAAPAMIGFVGLGVETGLWYQTKRQAQTAADTGAVAGSMERVGGGNVTAAAKREVQRNGFADGGVNVVTVHNPPTTGPNVGNNGAVEVIVSHTPKLLMASLFLPQTTIVARAVAKLTSTGTACVLALHGSMDSALDNQGSSTVDIRKCTMAANSTSERAITIGGSTIVHADSMWTAGNYYNFGSGNLTLNNPATVHVWPLDDPYAGLTIPALTVCNQTNAKWQNGTTTISPGIYCGGMDFGSKAVVKLNPGVYYVNRGDFSVNAQAKITCNCVNPTDGVTIILTSSGAASDIGRVKINGGALIELAAPSGDSAPYKGILMYQDRRISPDTSATNSNILNGGSALNLTGALYFPSRRVNWEGNNVSNLSSCTQIVALNIVFTGNTAIQDAGCLSHGVQPIALTDVRVVE